MNKKPPLISTETDSKKTITKHVPEKKGTKEGFYNSVLLGKSKPEIEDHLAKLTDQLGLG